MVNPATRCPVTLIDGPETSRRENPAPEHANATFRETSIHHLEECPDRNRAGKRKRKSDPLEGTLMPMLAGMNGFEAAPPAREAGASTVLTKQKSWVGLN